MAETNYVLIVDDDAIALNLMSHYLNTLDVPVLTATSGAMALDILDEMQGAVHLVLLDIAMPSMNGYEVCEAIRANAATAHLPVVAVTARTGPEVQTSTQEVGINEVITKPFEPAQLLSVIDRFFLKT